MKMSYETIIKMQAELLEKQEEKIAIQEGTIKLLRDAKAIQDDSIKILKGYIGI